MISHIAIQNTHDIFEIALFIDNKLIGKAQEDKRHTSKLLIPVLQQLLSKHTMPLAQLSFCAVNCGPGPFSTLRSIIASMNGLHLATNIPLISIDGLYATFLEFYDNSYENTVILLNAFNNESYYLIAHGEKVVTTGYKKTELLLLELQEQFAPNAVNIIDNKICSIDTVSSLGYEKFIAQDFTPDYLMPLHLKKHPVEL